MLRAPCIGHISVRGGSPNIYYSQFPKFHLNKLAINEVLSLIRDSELYRLRTFKINEAKALAPAVGGVYVHFCLSATIRATDAARIEAKG